MALSKKRNFIEVDWQNPFKVNLIEKKLGEFYEKPGIYIIRIDRHIPRMGGTDKKGILYIGSSRKIGNRIDSFWNAAHQASGVLWVHPRLAKLVFKKEIKDKSKVERLIEELEIKLAVPIRRQELKLAEKAALFAYMFQFGELPPLNFTIPGGRWEEPQNKELAWGKQGILY